MTSVLRVLSAARRVFEIHSSSQSQRCWLTTQASLLRRLMEEPKSRTKTLLASAAEQDTSLQTPDWESLITSLTSSSSSHDKTHLVLVKDLLRKYRQWSQDCIAVVGNISSNNVQEPKAKAALIWMLGEYSQDMQDAPYILEGLVDNWEEEHPAEVCLHLLTAVMKCFFKRPPETQKSLGAALAAGLADFHQDVHDRALFYYRLLQYDVSVAERVVNPPKQALSVFADTQSSEIKDLIFDEFNSLSVVYQKPSYMFTHKKHRGPFEFSDEIGQVSMGTESADTVVPAKSQGK